MPLSPLLSRSWLSAASLQCYLLGILHWEDPGGERWIETLPRRGYRFVGPFAKEDIGLAKVAHTEVAPALAVPDKPSIAALPFQNMSGDPEQEYFAHGMVEEIITALSRTRWLFVIARNSTFTTKGRALAVVAGATEPERRLRPGRHR